MRALLLPILALASPSPLPVPVDVASAISSVVASFLRRNTPGDCHWERATYFFGHSAAFGISNDTAAAVAFARAWASQNSYACGGLFDPNDIGGGWGYSALDQLQPGEPGALALGATMSAALAQRKLPPYSWWWVDTLSMNVPQWLYYGRALGRPDFIDFAYAQYNNTKYGTGAPSQPGLWSPAHGMWFRDHSYVGAASAPIFWARGQAWAAATIVKALSLGVLPACHPWAQDLEDTLAAMAEAVVPLQGADGFWRANMLNSSAFPEPETSGTAGLLALLAFGVRTGRLPAAAYLPAIARAWAALSTVALDPDGTVTRCQPENKEPGPSAPNSTSDFCAGLWLLGASEVHALASSGPLPPYDLRPFEASLLPRWLAQFALPGNAFAYSAGDAVPHAYGTAGVVHALSVVGQLSELYNASARAAMGAVGNTFENKSTGYYTLSGPEANAGFQPWHSGGWVLSALRLLGTAAAWPPATAIAFARSGAAEWEATMMQMLNGSFISGGKPLNVWAASHKIASLPAQLIISAPDWAVLYAPFFEWLWSFLAATASPQWGFWCINPAVNPPPPSNVCLGGAFHIGFVLACGGQPLPRAAAILNSTLGLQNLTSGLWTNAGVPSYMDQDGVYMALKASLQLGRARWPEVRRMCAAYVRAAAAALSDEAVMLGPRSYLGGVAHMLAGVVTPVALCAASFPDLVVTERPWVNTVDVGCFG